MPAWLIPLFAFPFRITGKAIAGLWNWMGEDVRHIAIFVLLLAALGAGWGWHSATGARDVARASAAKWQSNAQAWQAAHAKLVSDVQAQQQAAAASDRLNIERVQQAMQANNERTAHDYQARLDDTRTALDRVRGELAAIAARDPGDGGTAAMPAAYTARCRAVGAADCEALLAALPGQLAAAEDNTSRLIALQDYVRSMLAIDFSGATTAGDGAEERSGAAYGAEVIVGRTGAGRGVSPASPKVADAGAGAPQ